MTGGTVMRSKSALFAAAAMAIAGTGLMATAGTASAATTTSAATTSSPASTAHRAMAPTADAGLLAAYNGACGSGYKVVNSAGIANLGTVYLTYNSSTGKNCVVTIRNRSGSPVHMTALVQALIPGQPTNPVIDDGYYRSYAGPVYVKAKGLCVKWGGSIQGSGYLNPGSNCGSREG
jgi:hypothetical protein